MAMASASSNCKRARRIPDNEWDFWRNRLESLFLEDNKSQKQIVDIMAEKHNFVFTEVQLKRRFEKWRIKKYIPENDLKVILSLKRKRQAVGKDAQFQWRGNYVEQERIERASKRIKPLSLSPESIPAHIKIYTSRHQSPQSPLLDSSSEHVLGSLLSPLDTDMLFSESNNTSGMLNVELNNRNDFEFDPRSIFEGLDYNDLTFDSDPSNVFRLEDGLPFPLEPLDPVNFSGDIAPNTEACFGFNEMTTFSPQINSQDYPYVTNLSRLSSPHLSDTNWEGFLSFSPKSHAATPDVLHRSSPQSSISHGRIALPEPFVIDDWVRATSRPEKAFEAMDLEALTKPLMLMGDIFFTSLYQILNNQPSAINEENIEWVANEFRNILAASHEASASTIRKRLLKSKTNEASWTPSNRFSHAMGTRDVTSPLGKNAQELRALQILNKALVKETSVGCLSIKLVVHALQGSPLATTAAFTFTPAFEICKRGISATLVRAFDTVRGSNIARNITSFNVIPRNHPVVDAIKKNNIKKVEELFSSKQISPNDRLPNGTSLLSWAGDSLEITQLLLQEGATTRGCHLGISGVLYSIWTNAIEWSFDLALTGESYWSPPREFDYFRQISDIALNAGASVEDCESSDENRTTFQTGLIHLVLDYVIARSSIEIYSNTKASKLDSVVAYLIKIGSSIEHPNDDGDTPFLSAARQCSIYSTTFLQILLKHGVNHTAKDKKGRGALHLALKNYWISLNELKRWKNNSLEVYKSAILELSGHDNSESVIDFDEWLELKCLELLEDKLLFLLRVGCDPAAKDNNGFTVSDYANREGLSDIWHRAQSIFEAEQQGNELDTEDQRMEGGLISLEKTG